MIDSIVRRLGRLLLANWLAIVLVGGTAWILGYSMAEAKWVPRDTLIPNSVFWGLVFGWLLANSRFRGRWAAGYSIAISVLALAVAMSGLLPALWHGLVTRAALPDLLNTLNIRLWTLLYRISAWFAAMKGNATVGDTGFFVYLVSLVLWNTLTWFAWSSLRTCKVYPVVLWMGVLLAFNIQLSSQGIWQLWFYLSLALMMIIRAEYQRNHRMWDRRGVDYPDDAGFDWGGAGLGLTFLITSTAVAGSIIGTREGWQMLTDLLTVPRQQTVDTAEKLFSGVTPPKSFSPVIYARTPDLQNFAAPLPQGQDVIMWVKTSDPPPPPPEASTAEHPPQRYWRSKIYTDYTQTGWKLLPIPEKEAEPNGESPPASRVPFTQEFNIKARTDQWLYASNYPVQAGPGSRLRQGQDPDTILLTGKSGQYTVTSWVPKVTVETLEKAPVEYPAEIRAGYLQLPPSLPDRVRSLTTQITSGAKTPFERALRIQNYLRNNYRYDKSVPPIDSKKDFVDAFLFETQAGYCTHFASAMTVMLRLEGIPARVVAGYSMGAYDFDLQAYRVTANGAHAWVEVYFPTVGWIEFEPTPSQNSFRYGEIKAESPVLPEPEKASEAAPKNANRFIPAGLLGLLAAAALGVSYARAQARTLAGGAAGRLYWSMRASLRWAGIPSSPSTTPDEFLSACEEAPGLEGELRQVVLDVTQMYNRAIFSPASPPAHEVTDARGRWWQYRGRWLRYILTRRYQLFRESLANLLSK